MSDAQFDYIVIGSGAGGGPLAARLAEANHSVLLIEAGGMDDPTKVAETSEKKKENWYYQVPVFHGRATEDPDMRLDFYVRH
jgi:choline dehydrogenase